MYNGSVKLKGNRGKVSFLELYWGKSEDVGRIVLQK